MDEECNDKESHNFGSCFVNKPRYFGIMHLKRIVAFPLLSVVLPAFGSASTCVSEFQSLNDCLDDHGECSTCTIVGPMANPFTVGFCDKVNDSICNAFGCCQACEGQFSTYETCFSDLVSRVTFKSCEIDCARAPTPSPTSVTAVEQILDEELKSQGCVEKLSSFVNCTVKNPVQCGGCFTSSILESPRDVGFCTAATDAICQFASCCEPCSAEFVDGAACFKVVVEEVTNGNCTIDCDEYKAREPPNMGCIDRLQNYTRCVKDNPVECATCAVLNLPPNPGEDGLCEIATNSICGFAKCCSSCDDAFQEFDECFEDWVTTATMGKCKMDCDTFEGSSSVSNPSECVKSLKDYSDCVLANPMECASCVIENLPKPGGDDFCESAADSVCGFGDCCSKCTAEFDLLDDCVTSFAAAITLGKCKIDCSVNMKAKDIWWDRRGLRHLQ